MRTKITKNDIIYFFKRKVFLAKKKYIKFDIRVIKKTVQLFYSNSLKVNLKCLNFFLIP